MMIKPQYEIRYNIYKASGKWYTEETLTVNEADIDTKTGHYYVRQLVSQLLRARLGSFETGSMAVIQFSDTDSEIDQEMYHVLGYPLMVIKRNLSN